MCAALDIATKAKTIKFEAKRGDKKSGYGAADEKKRNESATTSCEEVVDGRAHRITVGWDEAQFMREEWRQ